MKLVPVGLITSILTTLTLIQPVYLTPSPPAFHVVTSLRDWSFRNVSSWSAGGGDKLYITADSLHPFAGRLFGGGERGAIRGTRAFGSGYPYGNTTSSSIAGRPFPFGVWPLWWGQNFTGCDEYGPELDPIRPGGPLVIQPVTSTTEFWSNITSEETYYIFTDRDTNLAIMTSIVTWCHATPMWPAIFEPETSLIKPENVILYYRASSFALAFKGYNNTWARNTSTEAPLEDSTSLPDVVTYSPFLACVQGVIGNALHIARAAPYSGPYKVTAGEIVGWVWFGLIGTGILMCFLAPMYGCLREFFCGYRRYR